LVAKGLDNRESAVAAKRFLTTNKNLQAFNTVTVTQQDNLREDVDTADIRPHTDATCPTDHHHDERTRVPLPGRACSSRYIVIYSSRGASLTTPSVASAKASHRIQLHSRLLSLQCRKPLSALEPTLTTTTPSSSPNASQVSTIPDAAPDAPDLDTRILSFALSRSKALTSHALSNLFRLSGVTTFQARELSGETLLGLRFDVFSPGIKRFVTPVYVLLDLRTVEKGAEKVYVVARHSAPAFLGLSELAGKHLPVKGPQDLARFVKELRRRVRRWRARVDAVDAVKKCAMSTNGEGWKNKVEKVDSDAEVSLVTVKWDSGAEARCVVDEKGDISKVVAMDRKRVRMVHMEMEVKGSLKTLPQRMGWHQDP
jgi:hypothetical protein